jgi:hypothetical protein
MSGEHRDTGRVVVGHDPGPEGRRALRYAIGLARWHRCPLYVVAVEPSPRFASPALPPVAPERMAAERREQIRCALLAAGEHLVADLDVRVAVVRGDPVATLARLADRPTDRLVRPHERGGGWSARVPTASAVVEV